MAKWSKKLLAEIASFNPELAKKMEAMTGEQIMAFEQDYIARNFLKFVKENPDMIKDQITKERQERKDNEKDQ